MSTSLMLTFFFFFNDTATTEIYTLPLHDALPIWPIGSYRSVARPRGSNRPWQVPQPLALAARRPARSRSLALVGKVAAIARAFAGGSGRVVPQMIEV